VGFIKDASSGFGAISSGSRPPPKAHHPRQERIAAELVREGLRLLHQYAVDWKAAQTDPEWDAAEDQHAAS